MVEINGSRIKIIIFNNINSILRSLIE